MAIILQNINVVNKSYWDSEAHETAKMARFIFPDNCWTFSLSAFTTCDGSQTPFASVFFKINFSEPKYIKEREFVENGFGKKTIKRSITKREYSFDFLTDDTVVNVLHEMYGVQLIKGLFPDGSPFDIYDYEIEQKQRIGDMQLCTIKFKNSDENIIGQTNCCATSVYQDAPYTTNCPPTNTNLKLATDDAEAASLGVIIGDYYELDYDNPYGASQGILKVRKT